MPRAERIHLEPSWKSRLLPEFDEPYMHKLRAFLVQRRQQGKTIYPRGEEFFAAFNLIPFEQVKVVILGQDPYHGPGQAHGLCFSVQDGVPLPPSLANIFKEMKADIGCEPPKTGNLSHWARQGVLLLNSVLTVEDGAAGSHRNQGWERFTDRIMQQLSAEREGLVFVLWGAYAQSKLPLLDSKRHLILQAPHPSPLSAHRGFFGSRPFSKINAYLLARGQTPIQWQTN